MPAAAPDAEAATRSEAWTEPTWVALASAADELVLAVKTLSPEGHLSSNAASQRTPALDLFPKLCQTKRFAYVKNTKPPSLCPSTDSLRVSEFMTLSLQWQNSLWFQNTSASTPTIRSLMRFPCKSIFSNTLRSIRHCLNSYWLQQRVNF